MSELNRLMKSSGWLEHAGARLPFVKRMRRAASDREFERNSEHNLFRGVFNTFQEAQASAPRSRPVGYDNTESANLYLKRLFVDDHDYPSMFWLSLSFAEGMRLVSDIGGAVGIKYFAFGKYIVFPQGLVWRVIDVPAVAQRGRAFAAGRNADRALEFSMRLADADGMDVIFASGALQYLPQSLPELLGTLEHKPRRIIINTTPIHASQSFYTLNSIGTAYCPYRVHAREPLIAAIEGCGYRHRAEWRNLGKQMQIPFEPAHSLTYYTGFCFDQRH